MSISFALKNCDPKSSQRLAVLSKHGRFFHCSTDHNVFDPRHVQLWYGEHQYYLPAACSNAQYSMEQVRHARLHEPCTELPACARLSCHLHRRRLMSCYNSDVKFSGSTAPQFHILSVAGWFCRDREMSRVTSDLLSYRVTISSQQVCQCSIKSCQRMTCSSAPQHCCK